MVGAGGGAETAFAGSGTAISVAGSAAAAWGAAGAEDVVVDGEASAGVVA
jgi:hypothetical protein